jgi:glycine betaine transporter
MFELNTLLVPVDFSPTSEAAFHEAISLVTGDKPVVILLHVVDFSLAADLGVGAEDDLMVRMREHTLKRLNEYKESVQADVTIETIVAEGTPFVEIVKKADEFHVHAIVMGKFGLRGKVEELLFGSTAERVIRASRRPVIVLPLEP